MQKKERDLKLTLEDLFNSLRFKIAVEYYPIEPQLLKDLFFEVGLAAEQCAKNTIISEYNKYGSKKILKEGGVGSITTEKGLDQYEIIPYLRSITNFNRYNIWWKPKTDLEKSLYANDPTFKLDYSGKVELVNKLKESSKD